MTLALRFGRPGDKPAASVADLLDQLKTLEIKVECLYLERGFDSIAVQQTITERGLKAIIACTVRGKTGGTRRLCVGHHRYRTRHNFQGDAHTRWEADMRVCRVYTTKRRTGRAARKAGWLLFILIGLDLNPCQARLSAPLRDREQLPPCQPGAWLDDFGQGRLSLSADRAQFCADQCLGACALAVCPSPAPRSAPPASGVLFTPPPCALHRSSTRPPAPRGHLYCRALCPATLKSNLLSLRLSVGALFAPTSPLCLK